MADQVLPITALDEVGVIKDTPPVALAPNAFSDARNVRFKDGSVRKMKGEVNIFPNIFDDSSNQIGGVNANFNGSIIKYVIWWPNPNLAVANKGYYVIIAEEERLQSNNAVPPSGNTNPTHQKDIAYLVSLNGTNKVQKGIFDPAGISQWQHTFFQGGFCLIVNNGLNAPNYIYDLQDNTNINNVPSFAQLPGWESYLVNQIYLQDTFDPTDSFMFDLGTTVNFAVEYIEITDYDEGTGNTTTFTADGYVAGTATTANNTAFVPPAFSTFSGDAAVGFGTNDKYEIYLDSNSNSIKVFLPSNLVHGSHLDTVTIAIKSRNPVFVACGVIRAFGDFLVAGNLVERNAADLDSPIIRSLNSVVRTSDAAAPGSVPNNWNPFASGVSTADEFVLSDTTTVKDLVEMQGNLYIYSSSSISVMRLTGNASVPVAVNPVTRTHGCQTTNAVLEFDGKHFVVGSQDIYLFAGHPGSIESVANNRMRKYLFDNLNPLHNQHMFVLRYSQKDELWICYPTLASEIGECNEALIWNYKRNTWTIRDLRHVMSGIVAPIPGGGLPQTDIQLTGTTGNNGVINVGAYEVRTIGLDSSDYISTNVLFYGSDTVSNLIYGIGRNGNAARVLVGSNRRFYETKLFPKYRITGPESISIDYTITNPNSTAYQDITTTQILDQLTTQITNVAGWTSSNLPTSYVQLTGNRRLISGETSGSVPGKRLMFPVAPFSISLLLGGNTINGTDPELDFQESTAVSSVHGLTKTTANDYRGIYLQRATPTCIGIVINNDNYASGKEFVIVNAGTTGDYNPDTHAGTTNGVSLTNEEAAEKLIAKLRNISPNFNVVDTGTNGEFSLQPASYGQSVGDAEGGFIDDIKVNTDETNADWIYARYVESQNGTIGYNTESDIINVLVSDGSNGNYPLGTSYLPVGTAAPTKAGSNDHQLAVDSARRPDRTTRFGTTPTLAASITEDNIFDSERPWDTSEINPNIEVPVFASRKKVNDPNGTAYDLNKIIASEIGWSVPSYNYTPRVATENSATYRYVITNNDAPQGYASYIERKQLGISPDSDTETVRKLVLWAEGKYVPYQGSVYNYNRFQIRMAGTNNPGQDIDLSSLVDSAINHNNFFVSEDYKIDMRTHGRFLNYRITDKILSAGGSTEIELTSNPKSTLGLVYNKASDWMISGMQAEIRKGGTR